MKCEQALEIAIDALRNMRGDEKYSNAADILEYGEVVQFEKGEMHVCKCVNCLKIYEWKKRRKGTFCPHCGAHFFQNFESVRAFGFETVTRRLIPRKTDSKKDYIEVKNEG